MPFIDLCMASSSKKIRPSAARTDRRASRPSGFGSGRGGCWHCARRPRRSATPPDPKRSSPAARRGSPAPRDPGADALLVGGGARRVISAEAHAPHGDLRDGEVGAFFDPVARRAGGALVVAENRDLVL